MPLRVGLVAGEASGDTLGAGLIYALRRLAPDAQFFGVAGPKMRAAGCEAWEPSESLAVILLYAVLFGARRGATIGRPPGSTPLGRLALAVVLRGMRP